MNIPTLVTSPPGLSFSSRTQRPKQPHKLEVISTLISKMFLEIEKNQEQIFGEKKVKGEFSIEESFSPGSEVTAQELRQLWFIGESYKRLLNCYQKISNSTIAGRQVSDYEIILEQAEMEIQRGKEKIKRLQETVEELQRRSQSFQEEKRVWKSETVLSMKGLQDKVQMYSHVLEDREKLLLNITDEYRESIMKQREFSEKMLSVPILEMKIRKMADRYFQEFTKILDHYAKDILVVDHMLEKWRQCFTVLLEGNDRKQFSSAIYEISKVYSTLTQLVVRFEPFVKKVEIQAIDEILQNYHVKKDKKDKEIAQTRFVFAELERMKNELDTDKDLSARVSERTSALERLVGRKDQVMTKMSSVKKVVGRQKNSMPKIN